MLNLTSLSVNNKALCLFRELHLPKNIVFIIYITEVYPKKDTLSRPKYDFKIFSHIGIRLYLFICSGAQKKQFFVHFLSLSHN
jgi:hypothetical protein